MITTFICDTKECPLEGIPAPHLDSPAKCVCGGCGKVLEPIEQ